MSVINTNLKALDSQNSMRVSGLAMSQAMERLSTGKKINSAKDDAAGLAISNRMTSQIRGLAKAIQNSNDAISMSQTAEGAYGNVSDVLQRMRELTVQAASGTSNDSDRANIQLEVKQLQSQIDDIANKTNHNNIKLLDGSASKIVIQTNVNSNDTLNMSFDSVKTKDIGVGSRATLMAVGGTSDTTGAISAGTLLLNGVLVGASSAVDDSATQSSGSAIAKAAAINKVANLSGVYAKVENNVVSGISMTTAASATGTLTINGVATDTIATATDNSLTRKLVVNAINAKTAQSGVSAIDTGDDTLGVTLVAADGRNITVGTTLSTSITGVRTGTETASYSLYTLDNRDILVDTVAGSTGAAAIANSGLNVGTFKSNQTSFTSYTRNGTNGVVGVTAAPTTSSTAGLLDNASLILNGVAVGAALTTDDTSSDTGATGSTRAGSAIAIAAAINRVASQTGVTATAAPNVVRGQSFTASSTQGTLVLNGTAVTVNSASRNGAIDSINAYSGATGVVASSFGDAIQLTAADGRNINLAVTSGNAASLGLGGVTLGTTAAAATAFYSQVTLSSSNKFTVQAGKTGSTNLEYLGFRAGTYGGSDNGLKINQVDVSTISGATQALTAIDSAIETVSRAQAKSGAMNNRLDSVISNLTETSTNIQASRSRILDADYAVETTNLAKQQIISQAATAMLAQANQQGQSVLSLLK
jgi:flagellin